MKRILAVWILLLFPILAQIHHLSLKQAIKILEHKNLEIRIARYEEAMKHYDEIAARGKNFGSLDLTIQALRSNDAGNVFGFKLQSREASFADFGFDQFLAQMPGLIGGTTPPGAVLAIEPDLLNYPKARSHFLTKFTYKLPLYTGGMLSAYRKITHKLYLISRLDTRKVRNEKIYELKKTFSDITLVETYIANLRKIHKNMLRLKRTVAEMKKVGYAKKTDILEMDARLAQVESMLNQARLNRQLAYEFLSFLVDDEVASIRHVRRSAKAPLVRKSDIERLSLDIQKAKMGLQIAGDALETKKAAFKPMVGAFAEYGSADNRLWNEFAKKDFYTVGVQLKWNLFNGGSDRAKLEKARLRRMKVARQLELAKKGIALKVKKLQTEIASLSSDQRTRRARWRLAREVYRTYEAKYKEGLASITDLLVKQSLELEALMKLLEIENRRNKKVYQLEKILDMGGRS